MLTADEGGRRTPFGTGYTPQFWFGTADVTGRIEGPEDGLVQPGDHCSISVERMAPVAIATGMRFAIREGSRTIGAGVVTAVD